MPIVYAQDILITPLKSVYHPGETFQAEINLTFDPLDKLESYYIEFLDNSNQTAPIGSILREITKNYYFLYTDLPSELQPGKYKLKVKNVKFISNSALMEISRQKEFNIEVDNSLPIISFSPSYAILNKDFNLDLKNKALIEANISISMSDDFLIPSRYEIIIPQASSRRLFINVKEFPKEDTRADIILSYLGLEYKIPIFYFAKEEKITNITKEENITTEPITNAIIFLTNINQLNRTLKQDIQLSGPLEFKNTHIANLYDLNFILTGNIAEVIKLNITSLDILEPNQTKTQFIWVNQDKNSTPGYYSGELILTTKENISTSLPIFINILEKEVTIEEQPTEELNLTEEPKEKIIQEPKKEKIKTSRIILLILVIVIILLIILYLYLKNRQSTHV